MTDYIRRTLAKAQFTGNFQSEYPTALIHALLDDVPSEDVRPVVRGKWVSVTFRDVGCSECGFIMDIMETNKHILNHANFCPNCGCAMEES